MSLGSEEPPELKGAIRPVPSVKACLQREGTALLADPTEASQIYGKGYYGESQSGGSLLLDPIETAYLVEMGRLSVEDTRGRNLSFVDLLRRGHAREASFEIRYLVYRDLRQRGYVVRAGPPSVDFVVLPRGGTLPKTPSRFWVLALSERQPFDLEALVRAQASAQGAKKTLLLGLVDEESELTYYRAREVLPRGHRSAPTRSPAVPGVFLRDRVSLFDPQGVHDLGKEEGFGSRVGDRLELSLLEALYLGEEGRLTLSAGRTGKPLDLEEFRGKAQKIEPDLPLRLAVYRHLRTSGLLPKTGFKYGAHFRAYERDPESTHARFLLHAVPAGFRAPWPEVARAVRLAHGVRKEFLLATPQPTGTPRYLHLERTRP
jgi:tRNA-intron endonuclease